MAGGKLYQGEWKVDSYEMHGWGHLIKSKNKVIYTGWFKDNKAHGKGRMVYDNGTVYEGDWFEGRPTGEGTCTYSDKACYNG